MTTLNAMRASVQSCLAGVEMSQSVNVNRLGGAHPALDTHIANLRATVALINAIERDARVMAWLRAKGIVE